MRKLSFFVPLILAAMIGFSCDNEEARNTEELIDPWLRERTPVSLRLENQVGVANISNNWRNDAEGDIQITLVTGALNLSKVKVEGIELKYGATASIQQGSLLDLSSGTASFVVTATNGEKRTYTVKYDKFKEPLEGTYHMQPSKRLDQSVAANAVVAEGGVSGNAIWLTPNDKNWQWQGGSTNLGYINDDVITFLLTGVNSTTGETNGTCNHSAGADGKYTTFVWNSGTQDLSSMYLLVPNGDSKWKKSTDGTISFYDDSDNLLGTCKFLGPKFSFTSDHSSPAVLSSNDYAFHRPFNKSGWWNGSSSAYYNDISRYIDNCRRVLWMVTKDVE